jgi:glycosyltransferase involved in cell wall biosynthesis
VVELPVKRAADVNRHTYADNEVLRAVLAGADPHLVDIHEEPFSLVARQVTKLAPGSARVVMYTAQNVDKRFPPPFAQYERMAFRRAAALYACSRQAASVARGKGFTGLIDVIPLGYDDQVFRPGSQSLSDDEVVLAFVGRLVPEKGLTDAVHVLDRVNEARPARLLVHGEGPDGAGAQRLAAKLGMADRLELAGWRTPQELAPLYRAAHVVLVPSSPTSTWVEQFGRVIVEAQASGAVVAGYDSGTIHEVGGNAALLAPVGAIDQLADGVSSLLADPGEFERRRSLGLELSGPRAWRSVAERQRELYRRALESAVPVALPRSPRARRELARAEFGPTALTPAGERPFALPVLREGGPLAGLLARGLDAGTERIPRRRSPGR